MEPCYVLEAPQPEEATVVNLVNDHVPRLFELKQNHPNPFNAQTTVAFSLPRAGHTTLEVYDLNGQRVVRLLSTWLQAGHHEVRLDFAHRASSTYFLRLQSGIAGGTRKMTLVK